MYRNYFGSQVVLSKFVAMLSISALLLTSLLPAFALSALAQAPGNITICHATPPDTAANGYEQITINLNGLNGHDGDTEDIIPPNDEMPNGQNWDTEGQAIWNNDCVVPVDEEEVVPMAKVIAQKVVCDAEEYLPNNNISKPITHATAQDWVDQSQGHCQIVEGWQFEYKTAGTQGNPGATPSNDVTGPLGGDWNTFTDHAFIPLDGVSLIQMREVLQEGYVPFAGNSGSNVSAEFYCHNDVTNYDNWEWIKNPEVHSEQHYRCVGFNALKEVPKTDITVSGTKIMCNSEEYLPNWGDGSYGPITATTATDWLYDDAYPEREENCRIVDWDFQWSLDGVADPDDNQGEIVSDDWNTFENSVVIPVADAGSKIWVREVWNNSLVPFTGQNTTENVSAEIYCHTDALHYDNWEYIDGLVAGETYHCVAWNVPVAQCEEGEQWAYEVESSTQGTKKGGVAVDANRSNPANVLGVADGNGGANTGFFSLGVDGTITVEFSHFVENVSGNDIEIYEITNGRNSYPEERATIEVSQDGSDWEVIGTASSKDANGISGFDFDSTGWSWIKFVRVTDDTNFGIQATGADGYDLDAIKAVNGLCEEPEEEILACRVDVTSQTGDTGVGNGNAVLAFVHGAWTTALNSVASWIWDTQFVQNPTTDESKTFTKNFYVDGPVETAVLTLAADNRYWIEINGTSVASSTSEFNYSNVTGPLNVASYVTTGWNTISMEVENIGVNGSNAQSNPAAGIYELVVNGERTDICEVPPVDPDPEPTTSQNTTIVSGNTSAGENLLGWLFNRDLSTQSPFEFNTDASSIGSGSLFVEPITNIINGNSDKFIGELFLLTPMAGVEEITYDFQIDAPDDTVEEHFYMNVYANFGESAGTKFYDCRYNVVPVSGATGSFTTVTFDPDLTYPVTTRTGGQASPYACPASPADMDTLSPGSTIRVIALNVGDTSGSDAGISGYLDRVVTVITTGLNTHTETYDFEPVVEEENDDSADLDIDKSVSPQGSVVAGAELVYTIEVENDGPDTATNVVVTDNLDSCLAYVSHNASQGSYDAETGTWTVGSIASGATVTLTLNVTVGEDCELGELRNFATVSSSDVDDPYEDNNSASASVNIIESVTPPTPPGPTSRSGQFTRSIGGGAPQVLGAFDEGLGQSCGLYMDRFIRSGRVNDSEQVSKLQAFLNKWMDANLPITGVYGPATLQAVNAFQEKYASEVLTPWGLPGPTGIVYLSTLRWINKLECPDLVLDLPPLTPWSRNPNVPPVIPTTTPTVSNLVLPTVLGDSVGDDENTDTDTDTDTDTEEDTEQEEEGGNGFSNFFKRLFGR